ncbi:MAG: hypothetical protein HY659_09380 [Rhizobiales bacterium]|nr:hypothetical protein [Hyphomicrobiales bacterium]
MTIRLLFAALVFVVAHNAGATAQAIQSSYTPLDLAKCRHVEGKAEEDYGEWHCKGFNGISVYLRGGDQRVTISYGSRAQHEPAASQTLAAFNSEGKTIEWRYERGVGDKPKPFATILRWNTTTVDRDDKPVRGQVLVITRLAPGAVCHVGYVDRRANSDANVLAQKIADEHARNFRCDTNKPITLGKTGAGFSVPPGN